MPCDDTCALFISSSKLPPTHSCAITAIGIYALQRIVIPKQEQAAGAPSDSAEAAVEEQGK